MFAYSSPCLKAQGMRICQNSYGVTLRTAKPHEANVSDFLIWIERKLMLTVLALFFLLNAWIGNLSEHIVKLFYDPEHRILGVINPRV